MKKSFTLFCTLAAMTANSFAADVWSGAEPHAVTWENTLMIDADAFAEAKVGDKIEIEMTVQEADVIELKSDGQKLPGTLFSRTNTDQTSYAVYMTTDMLAKIKEYGLEICGNKFTVSAVSVDDDGFSMPANAVWGGYFWISDWNTLEIWKESFDNYADQRYLVVYLSSECDNTGYEFNVLTQWGDQANDIPEIKLSNGENVEKTTKCAILDLNDVDLMAALDGKDRLMIQGNPAPESAPFNFTSIVLTNTKPDFSVTEILTVESEGLELVDVYTVAGIKVRSGVVADEALAGLDKGIYIVGNRKYCVK